MNAALVNTITDIVESVIVVNSLKDFVPDNYRLVAIAKVPVPLPPDQQEVVDLLKLIDPAYVPAPKQFATPVINPLTTKWTETTGFTDLQGNPLG